MPTSWCPWVFAVIIFTVVPEPDGHAIGQIVRHAPRAPQCLAAHRRQLGGSGPSARRCGSGDPWCSSPILPGSTAKLALHDGLPCYFGNPSRSTPNGTCPPASAPCWRSLQPPQQRPRVLHSPTLAWEEKVHSLRSSEQHGRPTGERHLPCPPEPVRRRHQLRQAERPAEPGRADQGDPPERHLRLGPVSGGQSRRHSSVRAGCQARPRVVTGPVTPLPGELLIALQPPREGRRAPIR